MTAINLICLINEPNCGREKGKSICPKCGIDEDIAYLDPGELNAAIDFSREIYKRTEKHEQLRLDIEREKAIQSKLQAEKEREEARIRREQKQIEAKIKREQEQIEIEREKAIQAKFQVEKEREEARIRRQREEIEAKIKQEKERIEIEREKAIKSQLQAEKEREEARIRREREQVEAKTKQEEEPPHSKARKSRDFAGRTEEYTIDYFKLLQTIRIPVPSWRRAFVVASNTALYAILLVAILVSFIVLYDSVWPQKDRAVLEKNINQTKETPVKHLENLDFAKNQSEKQAAVVARNWSKSIDWVYLQIRAEENVQKKKQILITWYEDKFLTLSPHPSNQIEESLEYGVYEGMIFDLIAELNLAYSGKNKSGNSNGFRCDLFIHEIRSNYAPKDEFGRDPAIKRLSKIAREFC